MSYVTIPVVVPCLTEQPKCNAYSSLQPGKTGVIQETSGPPYKTELIEIKEYPPNTLDGQECSSYAGICSARELCTDNCLNDDKCFNMVWDPYQKTQNAAYGNCSYYAEGVLKAKICCDTTFGKNNWADISVSMYPYDYPDNCHFCCDKDFVYFGPQRDCGM